ncbi:MAG: hypothetical protein LBT24_04710 [Tannerella sp.]|jgi:hypothetical protein|nr:hypothetical protein [Tannerella sp.]
MKEDLGNYLYWIIAAIAIVSSLWGKFKKAKSQQDKPKETSPQDWGDVLGELFGEKKPQPQPVVRQPAKPVNQGVVKKTQKPVYKPIPVYEMSAANEGTSAINPTEIGIIDIEEDTVGFSLEDIPNNAQEWRKVFVYNEIFGRKY